MDNRLIIEKSWWQKNWKWLIPTTIILLLLALTLTLSIGGNANDILQAYSDEPLYNNAFEKAKINKRVIAVLGELEPIDKLAIIEGSAIYSNNNNTVNLTVRISGSKGKGKMDIVATKDENQINWEYKKINIRIKDPKEEIKIIE